MALLHITATAQWWGYPATGNPRRLQHQHGAEACGGVAPKHPSGTVPDMRKTALTIALIFGLANGASAQVPPYVYAVTIGTGSGLRFSGLIPFASALYSSIRTLRPLLPFALLVQLDLGR